MTDTNHPTTIRTECQNGFSDRCSVVGDDLEWRHEENERKDPRSIQMAAECRERLTTATQAILKRLQQNHKPAFGLILSGGVDTCAILEAAAGVEFDALITVAVVHNGKRPPDELYSKYAAVQHGLEDKHFVVELTPQELIEAHLPKTIETLRVWDGMTIRNSLVISAAFAKAKSLGLTDVLVGDAADELFGGYSFCWGNEDTWKAKRDKMCRQWTFATDDLAASYGLTAHAPFKDLREWALSETDRVDCVADDRCAIQLVLGGPYAVHTTGKVLLREAFRTGASWRRKDPIETGSGATVIGRDDYWDIPDFPAEAERLLREEGIRIRTKENLAYLRVYRSVFGGLVHPTRTKLPIGSGCLGCSFELDPPEATFCHLCGAYPAQTILDDKSS